MDTDEQESFENAIRALLRGRDHLDSSQWVTNCDFVAHKFDKTRREVIDKVLELEALEKRN